MKFSSEFVLKNDALKNFEGIGIVTVHKQSSGVDSISLSED